MNTLTEARSAPPAEPQPDAAPKPKRPQRFAWTTPYAFLSPTLILLAVLMVVPITMVIAYSFLDQAITGNESNFTGISNYIAILTDPVFYTAMRNTIVFATVSVVAHFVIGMGFALMLNSPMLGNKTKAVFRTIYILPWLFTVAIVAVLWRMILSPNGVLNFFIIELGFTDTQIEWLSDPTLALPAITFINIWAGYPFFMVSLLAGLQGISKELYEAARIDRAGPVKQFFHVTLPQLKPIIISMGLLDFIWTTQQFALIWMTTGGGPIRATEMLSTFTYKLAFAKFDFAIASASAVVIFVLSMVLAYFYVRHQKARD